MRWLKDLIGDFSASRRMSINTSSVRSASTRTLNATTRRAT